MTIVVPVFNRPELIVRCLDSLLSQTWHPIRVIVVDNGSTDSTAQTVSDWISTHDEDSRFSAVLLHDGRKGAAYARQTGLDHVETDKVMFFDSDDVMRPECVSTVMQAWESAPDADVIAWPTAVHQSDGVRLTHSITGNLTERHLVHAILCTQGYAIKTDVLRDAGGWRGEFPGWNDLETGMRILLKSPVISALPESLVDIYPQTESITGTSFSSKAGSWEKSLDGIEESIKKSGRPDVRRLLNIVSYRRTILAAHYYREGHPDLAKPLYRQSLAEVSGRYRLLLSFSYHWTRCGLRGAFSLIGRFL